jgi:hypothetical protein
MKRTAAVSGPLRVGAEMHLAAEVHQLWRRVPSRRLQGSDVAVPQSSDCQRKTFESEELAAKGRFVRKRDLNHLYRSCNPNRRQRGPPSRQCASSFASIFSF